MPLTEDFPQQAREAQRSFLLDSLMVDGAEANFIQRNQIAISQFMHHEVCLAFVVRFKQLCDRASTKSPEIRRNSAKIFYYWLTHHIAKNHTCVANIKTGKPCCKQESKLRDAVFEVILATITDLWSQIRRESVYAVSVCLKQSSCALSIDFLTFSLQFVRNLFTKSDIRVEGLDKSIHNADIFSAKEDDYPEWKQLDGCMSAIEATLRLLLPTAVDNSIVEQVIILGLLQLGHPQLSLRQCAIRTIDAAISCSPKYCSAICDRIISVLNQHEKSSIGNNTIMSQTSEATKTILRPAPLSEGILHLLAALLGSQTVVPQFIFEEKMENKLLNTAFLYLSHPASSVRQAASRVTLAACSRLHSQSDLTTAACAKATLYILHQMTCFWQTHCGQNAELLNVWAAREGILMSYELIFTWLMEDFHCQTGIQTDTNLSNSYKHDTFDTKDSHTNRCTEISDDVRIISWEIVREESSVVSNMFPSSSVLTSLWKLYADDMSEIFQNILCHVRSCVGTSIFELSRMSEQIYPILVETMVWWGDGAQLLAGYWDTCCSVTDLRFQISVTRTINAAITRFCSLIGYSSTNFDRRDSLYEIFSCVPSGDSLHYRATWCAAARLFCIFASPSIWSNLSFLISHAFVDAIWLQAYDLLIQLNVLGFASISWDTKCDEANHLATKQRLLWYCTTQACASSSLLLEEAIRSGDATIRTHINDPGTKSPTIGHPHERHTNAINSTELYQSHYLALYCSGISEQILSHVSPTKLHEEISAPFSSSSFRGETGSMMRFLRFMRASILSNFFSVSDVESVKVSDAASDIGMHQLTAEAAFSLLIVLSSVGICPSRSNVSSLCLGICLAHKAIQHSHDDDDLKEDSRHQQDILDNGNDTTNFTLLCHDVRHSTLNHDQHSVYILTCIEQMVKNALSYDTSTYLPLESVFVLGTGIARISNLVISHASPNYIPQIQKITINMLSKWFEQIEDALCSINLISDVSHKSSINVTQTSTASTTRPSIVVSTPTKSIGSLRATRSFATIQLPIRHMQRTTQGIPASAMRTKTADSMLCLRRRRRRSLDDAMLWRGPSLVDLAERVSPQVRRMVRFHPESTAEHQSASSTLGTCPVQTSTNPPPSTISECAQVIDGSLSNTQPISGDDNDWSDWDSSTDTSHLSTNLTVTNHVQVEPFNNTEISIPKVRLKEYLSEIFNIRQTDSKEWDIFRQKHHLSLGWQTILQ